MIRVNKIIKNSLFGSCMQEIDEAEKERVFCGHGIEHLLSTARIMLINALEENLDIDKEIIYAAALLHDIGRARAYRLNTDHAAESAIIAGQILMDCGFEQAKTDEIIYAVKHHNDKEKSNKLCFLLRTADRLSRNCFACKAYEECNWSENKKNKGVTV